MSRTGFPPAIGTLALALLTSFPAAARAQDPMPRSQRATSAVTAGSAQSRIRGVDRKARRLIEQAVADSPTLARLAAALENSDLIVGIQLCPLPKTLLGDTRIVMATADVRYVRIRIRIPDATFALISVLGHELQHATELAAAPHVRDPDAQGRLYRQIGYEGRSGGFFETDAAREVGRQVAVELGRSPR